MFSFHFRSTFVLSTIIVSLFFFSGCKDDDESPTGPNGNTQTITVAGHVKDIDGEAISGVSVIVKGKSPVISDASGAFSVSGVTTPYEIRLILSTQKTAVVYQGLTRTDPTLLYPFSTTTQKSARISGSVPIAAGKTTLVFFISGGKSWSTFANQGVFSFDLNWKGAANSYAGKLQVLRWSNNQSGLPATFDAYASKELTISSAGTFGNNNFTAGDFTDPAEQSISGSITRPSTSYTIRSKTLYLSLENTSVLMALEVGAALTDNFSYTVPVISGATFQVGVSAEVSAVPDDRESFYKKTGITGGATGISITIPSAPQLNLPAHNGTGIDTTTQFLWAQGSGTGVNLVTIIPSGVGPSFYIITNANSTYIPNLSPLGLGLPVNSFYQWAVSRIIPVASVDEAATDTFVQLLAGYAGEYGQGYSEWFRFTTPQ